MVFSAVSMVSSFEADDDTVWSGRAGETKQEQSKTNNNCKLRYAILTQFCLRKRNGGKSFGTAALSKQKRNGPVAIL